jgi:pimeloyl-ACP methyl ester carboxylesterase
VIAPDALGFGASLGIGTEFGLAAQADAVAALLADSDGHRAVAAHSWGCAVAATLARRHPELVLALVLVSPAAFTERSEVRDRLARRSWLARATLDRSVSAALVCGLMCLFRRPLGALAPRAARRVPRVVARAGVLHSYPS